MSLIASDGYEYEDVKARLFNEPKDNRRNRAVALYRRQHYSETSVKAFYQAFDKAFAEHGCDCEEVLDAAIAAARATGCFGPLAYKPVERPPLDRELHRIVVAAVLGPIEPDPGGNRAGLATPVPPSPAPLHPADQPPVPGRVGA